ncbi:MAG: zinc-finger domain-containing protein [Paracoccaceae bacterium]|nr:zinc-finger domain-containing protein [Paracoccaceae bacterium]
MTDQPQEIEEVTSLTVACKGSPANMTGGHPKVWLKISSEKGTITCPYCEKTFVLRAKVI